MNFDKNLLGGATVLMLLNLLNEKDYYGYEIIRELAARSNNTFQFQEGSLYPVLHKMQSKGYVKCYRKVAETGKERKYYSITASGVRQLEAEKKQWAEFSASVNQVLGGGAYGIAFS